MSLEDKLMQYAEADPMFVEILKRMVEKEEENISKGWSPSWEWHDIGVAPYVLRKLVLDGIIRVAYKSRTHTCYELVDRQKAKEFIQTYEQMKRQQIAPKEEAEEIPEDLFDVIEGYDDIKKFIKLSLMADEPVHVLLVGPPGTGKSLFLMELERLPGSKFITAGTATRVGIRDIIFEELPRILIIDELDKINDPKDLSALLTWMESGRIIITKHRVRAERRGKGWVFAACNRTDNLPWELLDRFQVFRLKPYTKEQFIRVVTGYLTKRKKVNPELARYIAERVSEYTVSVREAIRMARLAKTKKEVDELIEIVRRYRE